MKTRVTFQTLVLLAVAPVLMVVTALWAWRVYKTTDRIILAGFDRKLLAVSQGTAALIDGDAHEQYQRRRTLVALAPLTDSTFVALDPRPDDIVMVDATSGGARRLARVPENGVRALTVFGNPAVVVGLASDGTAILRFDATGHTAAVQPLESRIDGLCGDQDGLWGWYLQSLFRVDPLTGRVTDTHALVPDSLLSVTMDPATHRFCALTTDRGEVVEFDTSGKVTRRVALRGIPEEGAPAERVAPPVVHAIAFLGGDLFGVGDSLFRIDRQTGAVDRGNYRIGFLEPSDPFYVRYRATFVNIQERARLSYLYTQVYTGEKQIYYVMDGTVGSRYSLPGSTDELPAGSVEGAEVVQFVGRSWISPIQHWQAWGLLKSCFAPIRDFNGRVVAMAGADLDVGLIRNKTRWALFGAIAVGLCSLVAAGFVSLRVAAILTRPLRQLKEAALWIAAGYYGRKVDVGGGREISALSATLDQLRSRLEHEQDLARDWQDRLRVERERTVLARSLDDVAVRLGATTDVAGALGRCRFTGTTVWWFGRVDADAVATACVRSRVVLLTHELLAAGRLGDDLLVKVLASYPELHGIACWHGWTETLHYCTRASITLHVAAGVQTLDGAGEVHCESIDVIAWENPAAQSGGGAP